MSVWTTRSLGSDKDYIVLQHPIKGVNNVVNGVTFRQGYAVVEQNSKTYHHLKKIPVLHKVKELPLVSLRKLGFITRTSDVKMVYGQDVYMAFLKAEEDMKKAKIQEELDAKAAIEAAEQAKRKAELEAFQKQEEARINAESAVKLTEVMEKSIEESKKDIVEIIQDSVVTEKVSEEEIKVSFDIKKCCYVKSDGNLCKHDALDYSPSKYCSLHMLEDDKLSEHGIKLPNIMTKNEKKKARKAVHKKLKQLKAKGAF